MRIPAMIFTPMVMGCLGCAAAEKTTGAATQPTEWQSEPGVSLKADLSRENGLTRAGFSWGGLDGPAILVVNFDTADPRKYNRGAALYGVTLVRRVPPEGGASLLFHHQRLAEAIQDRAVVNAFLVYSVRIYVSQDSGVKGSPVVRSDEFSTDAWSDDLTLIASKRNNTTQTAFITPPVEKLRIEMPPRGGILADVRDVKNVRAQVQVPIDLRLREGSADGH